MKLLSFEFTNYKIIFIINRVFQSDNVEVNRNLNFGTAEEIWQKGKFTIVLVRTG